MDINERDHDEKFVDLLTVLDNIEGEDDFDFDVFPEIDEEDQALVKVLKPDAVALEAANQVLSFEVIRPKLNENNQYFYSCLFTVENRLTERIQAKRQASISTSDAILTFLCSIPELTQAPHINHEQLLSVQIINDLTW